MSRTLAERLRALDEAVELSRDRSSAEVVDRAAVVLKRAGERGAFTGDFAIALERAAAFCLVTSAGSAELRGLEPLARATRLQEMAADLTACARLWRADALR